MIEISQKAGSQRNVTFHIHGFVSAEDLYFRIELPQAKVKLTSLLWLIEEKMGLYLCKKEPIDPTLHEIWMPLESRNNLRFDQGITIDQSELWLRPFKVDTSVRQSFFLIMDFDK